MGNTEGTQPDPSSNVLVVGKTAVHHSTYGPVEGVEVLLQNRSNDYEFQCVESTETPRATELAIYLPDGTVDLVQDSTVRGLGDAYPFQANLYPGQQKFLLFGLEGTWPQQPIPTGEADEVILRFGDGVNFTRVKIHCI